MHAICIRRVAGATALGGLGIPHSQQQFQIVLLAPHQHETKQGRDSITPPRLWTTSELLSRGFSQQD